MSRLADRARVLLLIVALLLTACNLEAEVPPPPDIPAVRFVAPANNTRVQEDSLLPIDVYAEDPGQADIVRIEIKLDGFALEDASTPGYQPQPQYRVRTSWRAQGVGLHTLSAVAYRSDGTRSDEQYISVEVVDADGTG